MSRKPNTFKNKNGQILNSYILRRLENNPQIISLGFRIKESQSNPTGTPMWCTWIVLGVGVVGCAGRGPVQVACGSTELLLQLRCA